MPRPNNILLAGASIFALLALVPARAQDWKWSPHSKPFDLVWDENNEDFNGLPLNPIWAWQLDHKGQPNFRGPDFAATCGPAIIGWPFFINYATLQQVCTSQHTLMDPASFSGFGYCPADPLGGHLDWTIATQTGLFYWSDWSGNGFDDGDYNLGFWDVQDFPFMSGPNPAPATDGFYWTVTSNEPSLGLEFNDYETVDRFGDPWWQQMKNAVENGNPATDSSLSQWLAQKQNFVGVVVGLIGIDGVHQGYAESHPVFALALRTGGGDMVDNTLKEDGVFFLTNYGTGGGCSSTEWHWNRSNNTFFIQLPGYPDATRMEIKGLDNVGVPAVWGWGVGSRISIPRSVDKKWTLIKIENSSGSAFGIDGEFTLTYTFPPRTGDHGHEHAPPPEPSKKKEKEDTLKPSDIASSISDATVRAKFIAELQEALKPFITTPPETERVRLNVDTSAQDESRTPQAASRGETTLPDASPDPIKKQRADAIKKVTDKYKSQMAQHEQK